MEEQTQDLQIEEWHHVITVEDLGGLKRKLHIVYDSIGVDMALMKATKLVSKRVQIKGFRRGKAPVQLVKNYCKKEIETSASSLLSQEGFLHACYEQKIQALSKPEVKDAEFKLDGTFQCDIFVEVKPTIIPSGYVGLQLKSPEVNIDQIFEKSLEDAKIQHATEIEKEEIEENDEAVISFVARCKGEEVVAGQEHRFRITKGQEPPFGENLIGMKIGENRESEMILPDNFKKHAGELAQVTVSLKSVLTKVPPTNEELVERMQAPSYKELENMIRKHSEMEANGRKRQAFEEIIVDKLIELHDFDVPENWVQDEENYLNNQFNMVAQNNDKELKEYIHKMADRNVRRAFILESIYDAEPNIHVQQEEIDEVIKQESERSNVSTLIVKKELKEKNMMDGIISMIRHKKVIDFILSQAQIIKENEEIKQSEQSIEIPENPLG
jgi:trigger factor